MNTTWQTGDRVLAWRGQDHCLWYPATVRGVEADHIHIEFENGHSLWLPLDQLQPLEVAPGSRVQCRWKAGSTYYSGTVAGTGESEGGAKLHIKYDDGDEEWAAVGMVRLSGSVPTSARAALVWTNPDAEEEKPTLVRLTADALTLAVVPRGDLATVVAGLGDGGTVAGKVIPLAAVTKVEADENGATLTVTYKTGGSKTKSEEIPLADGAAQEGLLGALADQLGPSWRRHRRTTSRWIVGGLFLVALACVAGGTWFFYTEAAEIAAGRQLDPRGVNAKQKAVSAISHWAEGLLGPTGVLIVGGVLLTICLLVFVAVMLYPWSRAVLEPVPTTEPTSPSSS
jgi:hypothetical protein